METMLFVHFRFFALWLFFVYGPRAAYGWTTQRPSIRTSSPIASLPDATASADESKMNAGSVPLPPWTFEASRIHYQFHLVKADVARRFTPPAMDGSLRLLSFLGWTLGGVFCVEYNNSPVGPYREVAILSSLVADIKSLSIGAWASHIYVDSLEAARYGEDFWGLPAMVVGIEMKQNADGSGTSPTIQFAENNSIKIFGWNRNDEMSSETAGPWEWVNLALPSFSGCLPNGDEPPERSPLIRYPLTIRRPRSLSFSTDLGNISFEESQADNFDEVRAVLSESQPKLAFYVVDVQLEAGIPEYFGRRLSLELE